MAGGDNSNIGRVKAALSANGLKDDSEDVAQIL
jgi:hypothetical protein